MSHVRMAAATIMMVTYGHQVTSADDEFVALAEAVREHSEKTPASNLVDVIPLRACNHMLSASMNRALADLERTYLSQIRASLVSRS